MRREVLTARLIAIVVVLLGAAGATAGPWFSPWEYKANMPIAQDGAGSAAVNGKIYSIGGQAPGEVYGTSLVQRYDPATNTWATMAAMPTPRHSLNCAVVGGLIYAIGGHDTNSKSANERYDPVTNTWQSMKPKPTAVSGLGVAVYGGKIYTFGGNSLGFQKSVVEVYDPASNSWQSVGSMPQAGEPWSAATLGNRIYLAGGNNFSNNRHLWAYDPVTNTWNTSLPDLNYTRGYIDLVVVGDYLVAVGGTPGPVGAVERWTPGALAWTTGTSLRTPRSAPGTAVIDYTIYAFGGGNQGKLSSTEATTLSWSGGGSEFQLSLSATEGGSVIDPGEGLFSYPPGALVYLEVKPDPGYRFVGWRGTFSDPFNPTCFEMDSDHEATAVFAEIDAEWYFVHMTDVHVGSKSGAAYLRGAVKAINKMDPRPAFVLVTGDIAQYAYTSSGQDAGFYDEYKQIMKGLDPAIRVYNVPGNHDRYVFLQNEPFFVGGSANLSAYCQGVGSTDDSVFEQKFEHDGFTFIGLDSGPDNWGVTARCWQNDQPIRCIKEAYELSGLPFLLPSLGLLNKQINELYDATKINPTTPKVIFMHHPAVDDKGWGITYNKDTFRNYCKNNNVQLVLAGHTHENSVSGKGGSEDPQYVQTAALSEGWYRVIRVKNGVATPEEPCKIQGTFVVTFDDGPFADGRTQKIVDALKDIDGQSVRAGFFMVGCNNGCEDTGAPQCCLLPSIGCGWTRGEREEGTKGSVHDNAGIVTMVKQAGHLIGNHTQHHIGLTKGGFCWDQAEVEDEIQACEDELREALGEEPARLFRPPYLWDLPFVEAAADELGYTTVLGELLYDWEAATSVEEIKQNALKALKGSSKNEPCILIFHDNGPYTADNIKEILEYLVSQGYMPVDFDP